MKKITQNGINLIKCFEGFKSKTYLDTAGLPTIGYRHLLRSGEALLIKDVLSAEQVVLRLIRVPLTDGQFDALAILHLQHWRWSFYRLTLRHKVNREEHDEVPEQFMRWVWAGGKKLRGLLRRRDAETELYLFKFSHLYL